MKAMYSFSHGRSEHFTLVVFSFYLSFFPFPAILVVISTKTQPVVVSQFVIFPSYPSLGRLRPATFSCYSFYPPSLSRYQIQPRSLIFISSFLPSRGYLSSFFFSVNLFRGLYFPRLFLPRSLFSPSIPSFPWSLSFPFLPLLVGIYPFPFPSLSPGRYFSSPQLPQVVISAHDPSFQTRYDSFHPSQGYLSRLHP